MAHILKFSFNFNRLSKNSYILNVGEVHCPGFLACTVFAYNENFMISIFFKAVNTQNNQILN